MIYQIKITLTGIRPAIWRRIQVRDNITLEKLHDIVQIAMGWENCHMHEFDIGGQQYGITEGLYNSLDVPSTVKNDKKVKLSRVITAEKTKFLYTYDFGDNWEHELLVEKILPEEKGKPYPLCLKGKRACPPEDCGGVWGYADLLEALKNPDDPEHEDLLEWAGEYDPEEFDPDLVNDELKTIK